MSATVLIVPGLRDDAADHWQTWLAARLPRCRVVPPMGRENLDCAARVAALERIACAIDGPILLVGHSGGVASVVHWARRSRRPILGALLATPPDFERPLPDGYPSLDALRAAGWLPTPRDPLPFPSIVAASRNDPLASFDRVADLARMWGARLADLGNVGHLNPASGFGPWLQAEEFIGELTARSETSATSSARARAPTARGAV